jgi:uncharacterized protein YjbJ (UPF0337 family)
MNSDTLSGQWKQLKGSAKVRWAKLTDDDLMGAEGNYDKLVGSIQERYGYARERAEDEVNTWLDSVPSEPARRSSQTLGR